MMPICRMGQRCRTTRCCLSMLRHYHFYYLHATRRCRRHAQEKMTREDFSPLIFSFLYSMKLFEISIDKLYLLRAMISYAHAADFARKGRN